MTKRLLLTISLKTEFRSLVQNLNFDDFYDRPDEKKSLNGPLVPSSPYTGNMDQRKIKKKIKKTRKKKKDKEKKQSKKNKYEKFEQYLVYKINVTVMRLELTTFRFKVRSFVLISHLGF